MRDRLPMIFSTTALVIALFGATPLGEAAYDAALPRNSVGTLQLKRNAVTSSKLAPNTIRTGQVVDGSLLSADFKPGQIPQGPKGDKGDKGDKGSKGDPGATNVVVRWSTPLAGGGGSAFGGRVANCNPGEVAVGGGGSSTVNTQTTSAITLYASSPFPNTEGGKPTGWFAGFGVSGSAQAVAYAVCARP